MSKFDFGTFIGEQDALFAVSRKYSLEEADRIFTHETGDLLKDFRVVNGYVYFGFGVDDLGEKQHGWFLSYGEPKKRTHVPVYVYKRKELRDDA
jgi:hypothetical protein